MALNNQKGSFCIKFHLNWSIFIICDFTCIPAAPQEHPHSIDFGYVLVVHSKTWVCLLKDEKDPSVIVKKEDVKRGLFKNLNFGKKNSIFVKDSTNRVVKQPHVYQPAAGEKSNSKTIPKRRGWFYLVTVLAKCVESF